MEFGGSSAGVLSLSPSKRFRANEPGGPTAQSGERSLNWSDPTGRARYRRLPTRVLTAAARQPKPWAWVSLTVVQRASSSREPDRAVFGYHTGGSWQSIVPLFHHTLGIGLNHEISLQVGSDFRELAAQR